MTDTAAGRHAIQALVRKLVARRKAIGLNQTELGSRMGVDPSYISRIEKASYDTKWSTVVNWATALGYDIKLTEHERTAP